MKKNPFIILSLLFVLSTFHFLLSTFLFSQDKPLVFTYPSRSSTTEKDILVKGVVTDDSIESVEISATNLWDLIETPDKDKSGEVKSIYERLEYKKVPVKGVSFSARLKLKEGMNAIIALPAGIKKTKENATLKVMIYDLVDKGIELFRPESERISDFRGIAGTVKDKEITEVEITIKALRKKTIKKESIYKVANILEKKVKLEKGKFNVPFELPGDLSEKGALVIYIKAANHIATKTLY